MTRNRLLIGLTSLVSVVFLSNSQVSAAQDHPGSRLFTDHSVLEVRVEAPLKTLMKERPDEEYLDGTFNFAGSDGTERNFDLKIQTRGRYRRQKKTCNFPPVRLNFRKGQVEGSLLEGQDKLKLVTHCQNRKKRYEQLVLREFLAYRMLQVLTDTSFGARLMRITWVDTDGADPIVRYGFVIEDDDDIGDRMGLEKMASRGLKYADLDPRHTNLINVYQYLIGNTDFSLILGPADDDCCHNATPFTDGTAIRSVPYDFDFSGLVNAPYAEPNPRFRIRDVRTRIYRGRCSNNGILQETLDYFIARKADLQGIVDSLDLDRKNRGQVTRYLDSFYDVISKPAKVQRELIKECS